MKIVVISHKFTKGPEREFWNVFAQKCDVDVDIVSPSKWAPDGVVDFGFQYDERVDSFFGKIFQLKGYFTGRPKVYLFSFLQFWRILLFRKYDLIVLEGDISSLVVLQLGILKWFSINKKKRFVLMSDDIGSFNKNFVSRWIEKINLKFVDVVSSKYAEIGNYFNRRGIRKELLLAPQYCSDVFFRNEWIANHNERDEIVFGVLGNGSYLNGTDIFFEAVETLISKGNKIRVAVGDVKNLADNGLQRSYVDYLGTLSTSGRRSFYGKVDVFIVISDKDSLLLEIDYRNLVEAVASSRIVATPATGPLYTILEKLRLPFTYESGSKDNLAFLLEKIIKAIREDRVLEVVEKTHKKCVEECAPSSVAQRIYSNFTNSF